MCTQEFGEAVPFGEAGFEDGGELAGDAPACAVRTAIAKNADTLIPARAEIHWLSDGWSGIDDSFAAPRAGRRGVQGTRTSRGRDITWAAQQE